MNRHMVQVRPVGGGPVDRRFWSPNRDLAYSGPPLIGAALEALDEDRWEPWVRELFKVSGVTLRDIGAAAKAVRVLFEMAQDINVKDVRVALEACGLTELRPAARTAVLAKIGQYFLGAVFDGIRDVALVDEPDPFRVTNLESLLRTAAAVEERLTEKGPTDSSAVEVSDGS
jgi:hypothetical protein